MSLSKYYLGRILGSCVEGTEPIMQPSSGPLGLYHQQFRALIGEVLQSDNLGQPGPYIPAFYRAGFIDAEFPKVSRLAITRIGRWTRNELKPWLLLFVLCHYCWY